MLFSILSTIMLDMEINLIWPLSILTLFGNGFIFVKCGLPYWQALIPVYRDFALAKCADREMDGRVLFLLKLPIVLGSVALILLPVNSIAVLMTAMVVAVLFLIHIIYLIRVRLALLRNFSAPGWWIIPFTIIPGVIALILGLGKKWQPCWKVPELEEDDKTFFDNHVSVLQSGLTVNLKKRTTTELFKTFTLLRDVHMNIEPGSMVLLLGGSGAGKTTLLNAINGYEKADAEIMLDGKNVYREYKRMMYEIGFVPQQDLMRGSDTVRNTLTDAAALRLPENFSRAERKQRVEEVMNIFGLKKLENSLVDKLSGGQRKRLSISMEFLSNPTLFILDEPDSGLDGVMARELMQQLRNIADQGKIVIVITHTPDRVVDLFDHVIVLAKDSHQTGRLAFYGPIDEARRFFGRDRMEQIVKSINSKEEGGDGMADELIRKFAEVQHA